MQGFSATSNTCTRCAAQWMLLSPLSYGAQGSVYPSRYFARFASEEARPAA